MYNNDYFDKIDDFAKDIEHFGTLNSQVFICRNYSVVKMAPADSDPDRQNLLLLNLIFERQLKKLI